MCQSEYVASITRRRAELARWLWDLSKTPLPSRGAYTGRSDAICAPLVTQASQAPIAGADNRMAHVWLRQRAHSSVQAAATTTFPGVTLTPGRARSCQRCQPCDARGGWGGQGLAVRRRPASSASPCRQAQSEYVASILSRPARWRGLMWDLDNTPLLCWLSQPCANSWLLLGGSGLVAGAVRLTILLRPALARPTWFPA